MAKKLSSQLADMETKVRTEFAARHQDLEACGAAVNVSDSNMSDNAIPFEDESQKVVLLNITHRNQIPKSKIPGFRICGAFPDINRLKQHALSVGGPTSFGGANLLKADTHKKFLICSSWEKQQNADYVMKKIEDLTERYGKLLQFHTEEFNENKQKRQQGKTGLSSSEKIKKHTSRKQILDKKFDEESRKGSESGEVSRVAEVRKQSVAVISVIDDISPSVLNGLEDPEPIIIVWGCFEDDKQAKHYIYNTASKRVKDVMLDIVNMYEWSYPTEMAKHVDEIDEDYRHPTLSKVMSSRKKQKASVMSYEEWVRNQQMEPSSLEITATKQHAEDVEVKTEIKKTEDLKMSVFLKGTEVDEKGVVVSEHKQPTSPHDASVEMDSSNSSFDNSQGLQPHIPHIPHIPQHAARDIFSNAEQANWTPVSATQDVLFQDTNFKDPSIPDSKGVRPPLKGVPYVSDGPKKRM